MNTLPLSAIRVVDLSHSWAGPHCTRLLADFGAEVIKVEYPRRLCLLRGSVKEGGAYNRHPAWFQVNRNKLSITLDLTIERDRAVLTDLVRISDVLVENSRTGVMEKLGFGYSDLVKIREDLIVLAMPAFGHTGPYASYAGYGAMMEALGGIQSLTAYESGGKPYRIKELDVTNGVAGACAVLTALVYRQRTGKGQRIELSQLEAASHALIGEHLLEFMMKGTHPPAQGNRHRVFAPQGCYRCKGEDKWVTLTVRSEEEWRTLCEVIGHPGWASDPRFATRENRIRRHNELDAVIEGWTMQLTHYEAMEILQRRGIPAGAVLDVRDLGGDPHLKGRGYFLAEGGRGESLFMGAPFRLSGSQPEVRWRGPDLGAHNRDVACGLLGRPQAECRPVDEADIGTAYDPA
jgi:crotonobetainyl-CoA:carnitine CoA-transferase CaiB-like acyl-CoA transferase